MKSFGFVLALLALGWLGMQPAKAELLIYSLDFDETGTTVNYTPIPGGYAVVDYTAGTFSTVVVLSDPDTNQPYYVTDFLSGNYLEMAREGGGIYGVLSSLSGGSEIAESVGFQVIGKTSGDVDVGPGTSLRVAKKLKGFLLLNGAESVSSGASGETVIEYGIAGSSKATARFDQGSTEFANDQRMDSATAITAITEALEDRGIGPEPTPSPSPTPGPSPSPTVSP